MEVYHGDSLEVLRTIQDNSVDSVVTDPPYGISFMGKKWDYDVPSVELWNEVLRVLKPGGHALVACGTRTQHRMAVNLEDAGFEIRDIVAWVYGSGFPKSLNIGKAVDKLQGNEREEYLDEDFIRRNPKPNNDGVFESNLKDGVEGAKRSRGVSEWEGWGTALKPAMELWTLCRKPLAEKTVAENVLKFGTGGINIDECRVGTHEYTQEEWSKKRLARVTGNTYSKHKATDSELPQGRFPANLIHDGSDEVVSLFPNSKAGKFKGEGSKSGGIWAVSTGKPAGMEYGDEGSAARFFYCAKASKSERNKGLEKNNHPTVKPIALMRYLCKLITPPKGIVLDPFTGSGSTGVGAKMEGFDFLGIEREEEYCKIALARLQA